MAYSWPRTSARSSSGAPPATAGGLGPRLYLRHADAAQDVDGLAEVVGRDDGEVGHERRFGRVRARHDQPGAARGAGGRGDRERAADRSHAAVEGELAGDGDAAEMLVQRVAGRGKEGERDREVVGGALFAEMGGSEVHGDAAGRDLEAGVPERGADAVFALADARVRETHGLRVRDAGREVDLDLHGVRVDTDERAGDDGREHAGERPRRRRPAQRYE